MGCSSGKEQRISIKSFKLTNVGVKSVDAFTNEVEQIINTFGGFTDSLESKREKLAKLTGFDKFPVKERNIRNFVSGILLQFFAIANGDNKKFTLAFQEDAPWLIIKVNDLAVDKAVEYIKTFEEYAVELAEGLLLKLPPLLKDMIGLVEKAIDLQKNAQSEFEALDPFGKVSAVAKTVKLVTELPKLPKMMTQIIKDIEIEIEGIKGLVAELKEPQKFSDDGKKCAKAKKFTPTEAFYYIHPMGSAPKK